MSEERKTTETTQEQERPERPAAAAAPAEEELVAAEDLEQLVRDAQAAILQNRTEKQPESGEGCCQSGRQHHRTERMGGNSRAEHDRHQRKHTGRQD